MDLFIFADQNREIKNPYAGKTANNEWLEGTISVDFLNANFGQYETLNECIEATESEGLKLFFEHLKATQ